VCSFELGNGGRSREHPAWAIADRDLRMETRAGAKPRIADRAGSRASANSIERLRVRVQEPRNAAGGVPLWEYRR